MLSEIGTPFFRLLLPLCETSLPVIRKDKRMAHYSEVEEWSNLSAYHIGLGGSYGHGFKNVKLSGIVCHCGCIVSDGVRGGISCTIYFGWKMGAEYNDDILQGMNCWHRLQIK